MTDSAASRLARHAARLIKDLPVATGDALCVALERAGATESSVIGCVTQPGSVEDVRQLLSLGALLDARQRLPQLALMLRAARAMDSLHRDGESIDLVWTGPNPPRSALFRTEQTLLDLIRNAERTLLIVTYAAYRVDAVRIALADALDRDVYVKLVVELGEEDGGGVSFSPLHALKKRCESRMAIYAWPLDRRPKTLDGKQGSLHAKCAVADDDVLLVSSANLTSYALELNMELGVLVTGGDAPRRVREHFEELIRRGILQSLEP